MAPADGKGDCEDYVLTKLFLLAEIGFPYVSNAKIVTVTILKGGKVVGAHAILAVLMPKGSIGYLDMTTEPMTRAELEAKGYHFFDWRA
jgi:predicted transglutaminase-like cysteine proteinase